MPKPLIVARYFAKQQAEIDDLLAKIDVVASEISELSEEYGGEEGILKDATTNADAQGAYTQAIVALWNELDASSCAEYRSAVDAAESYGAELRHLGSNDHFSPLRTAKGKLTLKAVKDRLAQISAGNEHAALTEYVNTDKKQKDAANLARDLFANTEPTFVDRLILDPVPDDLRDLHASVRFLQLLEQQSTLKSEIKEKEAELDLLAYEKYPTLTEKEIKTLVVDDKWLATIGAAVQSELDRVSQALTGRIRMLADRYAATLPILTKDLAKLAARVDGHLKKMGAA